MTTEYFIDTSFYLALTNPRDKRHERALAFSEQLERENSRLISTPAIVFEVGSAFARRQRRQFALRIFESMRTDRTVEVVPLTESNYSKAIGLFAARQDKEWSLTDCLSFVVMAERGISKALTTDAHFIQAGFEALLL